MARPSTTFSRALPCKYCHHSHWPLFSRWNRLCVGYNEWRHPCHLWCTFHFFPGCTDPTVHTSCSCVSKKCCPDFRIVRWFVIGRQCRTDLFIEGPTFVVGSTDATLGCRVGSCCCCRIFVEYVQFSKVRFFVSLNLFCDSSKLRLLEVKVVKRCISDESRNCRASWRHSSTNC